MGSVVMGVPSDWICSFSVSFKLISFFPIRDVLSWLGYISGHSFEICFWVIIAFTDTDDVGRMFHVVHWTGIDVSQFKVGGARLLLQLHGMVMWDLFVCHSASYRLSVWKQEWRPTKNGLVDACSKTCFSVCTQSISFRVRQAGRQTQTQRYRDKNRGRNTLAIHLSDQ